MPFDIEMYRKPCQDLVDEAISEHIHGSRAKEVMLSHMLGPVCQSVSLPPQCDLIVGICLLCNWPTALGHHIYKSPILDLSIRESKLSLLKTTAIKLKSSD